MNNPYSTWKRRRPAIFVQGFSIFALVYFLSSQAPPGYKQNNLRKESQLRKTTLTAEELRILRHASFMPTPSIESHRVVIATAATRHYTDLLGNLRCWIRKATGAELVLFALDNNMASFARDRSIPVVDMLKEAHWKSANHSKGFSFASSAFNAVTKVKLRAVREVLASGFNVVFTDVDTVWCDNAVRRLVDMVLAGVQGDILIQNDVRRDGDRTVRFNTGFYYAKAREATVAFFDRIIDYAAKNPGINDQTAFIRVACKIIGNGTEVPKAVHGKNNLTMCRWKNDVEIRALPLKQYPNGAAVINGKSLSEQAPGLLKRMCLSKQIVVWHNNWSKSDEKKQRAKDQGLWAFDEATESCVNTSSGTER